MNEISSDTGYISNNKFYEERKDLAAAFRWAEKTNGLYLVLCQVTVEEEEE